MCGIVGYIGTRKSVQDVLVDGLTKLEYRGYDSAGVAYVKGGKLTYERSVGEVKNLEAKLRSSTPKSSQLEELQVGIAHTRWATHGKPSRENAHPHHSGSIYIVHNGIIENYKELKAEILKAEPSRKFKSETDSEVLVHLIDIAYQEGGEKSLAQAVHKALVKVRGAYAIAVLDKDNPNELVLARKSSPMVLGIIELACSDGRQDFIIASDASAIIAHTSKVVYLDDDDIVTLKNGKYSFAHGGGNEVQELEYSDGDAQLEGFNHFMSKEIHEQPEVITNAYRGRIVASEGKVVLGGISDVLPRILKVRRIIIVSCGTSYNAGLVAEYLIERLAGVPVEVEFASEFRYRQAPLGSKDVVLAISQSGETADTLAAVREAKRCDVLTLAIVNVVGSSIARETDAGIYNHAGPEVSVASTKAFSSQLTVLTLLAILLGRESGALGKSHAVELLTALEALPSMVGECIQSCDASIKKIVKKYAKYNNALYLGRGLQAPLASEGALKIKEIAYIHAEGYPSGEMKHGAIALIDESMLSVVIAVKDSQYEKSLAVIEEVKARGGTVLAITTSDALEVQELADDYVLVPSITEELLPLLTIVSMQLLAYYSAIERGHNVDRPRNLAKSVTVE